MDAEPSIVSGRLWYVSHTVNSRTPSSRSQRSGRSSQSRSRDTLTREERKEATRRAIVAAALRLLEERSFSALSLREVTREAGIVPAAFYRHFESMEALGLVLIDESFRSLRDMLRGARAGKLDPKRVIESSVDILVGKLPVDVERPPQRQRLRGRWLREPAGPQWTVVHRPCRCLADQTLSGRPKSVTYPRESD